MTIKIKPITDTPRMTFIPNSTKDKFLRERLSNGEEIQITITNKPLGEEDYQKLLEEMDRRPTDY